MARPTLAAQQRASLFREMTRHSSNGSNHSSAASVSSGQSSAGDFDDTGSELPATIPLDNGFQINTAALRRAFPEPPSSNDDSIEIGRGKARRPLVTPYEDSESDDPSRSITFTIDGRRYKCNGTPPLKPRDNLQKIPTIQEPLPAKNPTAKSTGTDKENDDPAKKLADSLSGNSSKDSENDHKSAHLQPTVESDNSVSFSEVRPSQLGYGTKGSRFRTTSTSSKFNQSKAEPAALPQKKVSSHQSNSSSLHTTTKPMHHGQRNTSKSFGQTYAVAPETTNNTASSLNSLNNSTYQSIIIPDVQTAITLLSTQVQDGAALVSSKGRSSYGPATLSIINPEDGHLHANEVPFAIDAKSLLASLQFLQQKVAALEEEKETSEKKLEEYELEILQLKSQMEESNQDVAPQPASQVEEVQGEERLQRMARAEESVKKLSNALAEANGVLVEHQDTIRNLFEENRRIVVGEVGVKWTEMNEIKDQGRALWAELMELKGQITQHEQERKLHEKRIHRLIENDRKQHEKMIKELIENDFKDHENRIEEQIAEFSKREQELFEKIKLRDEEIKEIAESTHYFLDWEAGMKAYRAEQKAKEEAEKKTQGRPASANPDGSQKSSAVPKDVQVAKTRSLPRREVVKLPSSFWNPRDSSGVVDPVQPPSAQQPEELTADLFSDLPEPAQNHTRNSIHQEIQPSRAQDDLADAESLDADGIKRVKQLLAKQKEKVRFANQLGNEPPIKQARTEAKVTSRNNDATHSRRSSMPARMSKPVEQVQLDTAHSDSEQDFTTEFETQIHHHQRSLSKQERLPGRGKQDPSVTEPNVPIRNRFKKPTTDDTSALIVPDIMSNIEAQQTTTSEPNQNLKIRTMVKRVSPISDEYGPNPFQTDPGIALSFVMGELEKEVNELELSYERKRKWIKDRAQRLSKSQLRHANGQVLEIQEEMGRRSDQLNHLLSVLEGQKDSGQIMREDEAEMTLLEIGLDSPEYLERLQEERARGGSGARELDLRNAEAHEQEVAEIRRRFEEARIRRDDMTGGNLQA